MRITFVSVYLEPELSDMLCVCVSQQLEADLGDLQSTLGLGPKEVAAIRYDVVAAAYKCASQTASVRIFICSYQRT